MKIGILTFHRCINYGSYWQARCLADGLRRRGHEVELLDHHSAEATRAEWRCALQPLLPMRSSRSDLRLYAAKARKFERAFDALPLSEPFPLQQPERIDGYDLVIVGSDEVWNLSHPWYGGQPIFYGAGVRAERVASYAASFGNYDADAGLDGRWTTLLQRLAAISVRDENSRKVIRDALGQDPVRVLDPCLQFPPAPAPRIELALDESPYVALYGHSFPGWFRTAVRRWAKRRGYRLLSIGYRNSWADGQRITAGPAEFAALIARSAAVVTNFFHGCVFALLNAKPFACAVSPYRSNKLLDLTCSLGAEAHLVDQRTADDGYASALDRPLAPIVAGNLAALRRESDSYLRALLV
jgi:hypothetical protein